MKLLKTFLFLQLLFTYTFSVQQAGPFNPYYTIPYYYGSRIIERTSKKAILEDEPSLFFWSNGYNVDYRRNLWVVDKKEHTVFYISKEQETWNAVFKVTGKDGQAGYRDGNIVKATFNQPSSICIYSQNLTEEILAQNLRPIYMIDQSANCKRNINQDNYRDCGILIDEEYGQETIDERRVKYVPFANLSPLERNFQFESGKDPRVVYIVDRANHCVRRLVVQKAHVDTYAGICTKAGFKDGPYGTNMLNNPELAGVDALGNLFIHDSGNGYVRMVTVEGFMYTLLQGACKEDKNTIPPKIPFQLSLRAMICYRKWIKTSGKPDIHLVKSISTKSDDSCTDEHYVNCPSAAPRPLVMEKNFTTIEIKRSMN